MSQPSPISVAGDLNVLALQKKCERLRNELARERRRLVQATVLTALLGLLIMIVLGYFFYSSYGLIQTYTEPSKVVDYLQATVDEQLPDVRHSIEEQISQDAPIWAADLSKQAVASTPKARKKIEEGFLQHVDGMLKENAVLTDQEFEKVLKDHSPLFDQLMQDAQKGVRPTEKSLAELHDALERDLQLDMKNQASEIIKNIESVRENLTRLAPGKHLTPDQDAERQFYMIARRLQLEQTGDAPNAKPKATAGAAHGKQDAAKGRANATKKPSATKAAAPTEKKATPPAQKKTGAPTEKKK